MHNLTDLLLFAKVAEHGGFSPAARALDLPKSTLSRRISALEEAIGARLIQRTSSRFSLTEIGEVYLVHCRAIDAEAQAAQETVERWRAEPHGQLRVSCPIALAQARVSSMLSHFLLDYPKVAVRLIATNRRVDMIEEGIDVALRVRFPPLDDSDLVMRVLARSEQALVGQPALLARRDRPRHPDDLRGLEGIDLIRSETRHAWELGRADGHLASVPFAPRFTSDDMVTLRQAAIDGVGIVQLPVYLVRDHIAAGALERVLPDWTPTPGIIHAVFPSRRSLAPSVRGLIDFLAERFGADG